MALNNDVVGSTAVACRSMQAAPSNGSGTTLAAVGIERAGKYSFKATAPIGLHEHEGATSKSTFANLVFSLGNVRRGVGG